MLSKPAKTIRHARHLRRALTPPEVKLWCELRLRPGGLRFRRQHPAGPYVLDFYCAAARLAIEVDGEGHGRGDRPERDERRDSVLAFHGVATFRIPAPDVMRDVERAVRGIVDVALRRLPLHHPAAPDGPPPQAGLGED